MGLLGEINEMIPIRWWPGHLAQEMLTFSYHFVSPKNPSIIAHEAKHGLFHLPRVVLCSWSLCPLLGSTHNMLPHWVFSPLCLYRDQLSPPPSSVWLLFILCISAQTTCSMKTSLTSQPRWGALVNMPIRLGSFPLWQCHTCSYLFMSNFKLECKLREAAGSRHLAWYLECNYIL